MSPMRREEIAKELGRLYRDLPPSSVTRTGIHEPPPQGAAEFARRERQEFVWKSISRKRWAALSDEARGEILIARGEVWLDVNAHIKSSPVAFVPTSATNATSSRLFGRPIGTLREAILATHRLMKRNPIKAKGAILSLEVTILLITGLHPVALIPPAIDLLIEAYAEHFVKPV